MRQIVTTTFVTLDGVMQAPGGPEEDRTGGFAQGGWVFNYQDEMTGALIDEFMEPPFELLLGRRTYEIFAAYWPYSDQEPVAGKFNSTRKYVVSHGPLDLTWQNSTLITGDVPAEIARLKEQPGPDLWVYGSANLIQALLAGDLIDVLHIWTFPLTVGGGKRLFAEGAKPGAFKLVASKVSTTGVHIATYEPAGALHVGSYDLPEPSAAELARRARIRAEQW